MVIVVANILCGHVSKNMGIQTMYLYPPVNVHIIINLANRSYCNADVCLSVGLCICVSTALYHTMASLNMG